MFLTFDMHMPACLFRRGWPARLRVLLIAIRTYRLFQPD